SRADSTPAPSRSPAASTGRCCAGRTGLRRPFRPSPGRSSTRSERATRSSPSPRPSPPRARAPSSWGSSATPSAHWRCGSWATRSRSSRWPCKSSWRRSSNERAPRDRRRIPGPAGRRGDVLAVFSAMGNSPNIVEAVKEARALGLGTIGFLGNGGGAARGLVDIAVVVESDDYGVIEDAHLALNHLVTDYFARWVAE